VTSETAVRIDTLEHLDAGQVSAVAALVADAVAADGRRPLSEHTELHLKRGGEAPARHVLATDGGRVLGYAHVDPTDQVEGSAAELVVHPGARRHGLGRALVRAAEAASPDGRLRLWSHGDHPAAGALATSLGYERIRSLWLMRRDLAGLALPEVEPPDGVTLRSFRPGEDDGTWVALNAAAFADHPEQGAMTLADLHARMAEPWFDPEGFLVAEDAATGEMLGFHWTKVHGDGHEPIGEVYVVGVSPSAQGRGLGRVLTLAGLHHLRNAGLRTVILYVESDNAPALRVYTALGFEHADTDVMYARVL
jgi:mycothiol synthase